MTKKTNPTIVITAIVISCALLVFARFEAFVPVSAVTLFIAAAVICLLPAVYTFVRRRSLCKKLLTSPKA
jgi:hypothetical protein